MNANKIIFLHFFALDSVQSDSKKIEWEYPHMPRKGEIFDLGFFLEEDEVPQYAESLTYWKVKNVTWSPFEDQLVPHIWLKTF